MSIMRVIAFQDNPKGNLIIEQDGVMYYLLPGDGNRRKPISSLTEIIKAMQHDYQLTDFGTELLKRYQK